MSGGQPCARGQSLLETSILGPMLLLMFLGMVDFGWYAYCFIQVGNAARVAAQYTATKGGINDLVACQAVLRELKSMANVAALGTCAASPLKVKAVYVTDVPTPGAPGGVTDASQVTVTYTTMQLFQLPFLPGQMEINRVAMMRKLPTT